VGGLADGGGGDPQSRAVAFQCVVQAPADLDSTAPGGLPFRIGYCTTSFDEFQRPLMVMVTIAIYPERMDFSEIAGDHRLVHAVDIFDVLKDRDPLHVHSESYQTFHRGFQRRLTGLIRLRGVRIIGNQYGPDHMAKIGVFRHGTDAGGSAGALVG
jgi:hypothetical protein